MQLPAILILSILGCIFAFIDHAVFNGNIGPCANELATKIYNLHHWSKRIPDTICGFPCTGNVKARFSRWEWTWDAQFRCDSKAPGIIGKYTDQNRAYAKEWAIKDFVQKAIAAGHIKAEDIKC